MKRDPGDYLYEKIEFEHNTKLIHLAQLCADVYKQLHGVCNPKNGYYFACILNKHTITNS